MVLLNLLKASSQRKDRTFFKRQAVFKFNLKIRGLINNYFVTVLWTIHE